VLSRLEAIEQLLGPPKPNQSLDERLVSFLENSEQLLNQQLRTGANMFCGTPSASPLFDSAQFLATPTAALATHPLYQMASEQIPMDPKSPVTDYSDFGDVLEEHLLGLSDLFFSGFSVDNQFRHVILLDRGRPLSPQLRKALCYHGIFMSKHPQLFPGIAKPTFEDRLRVSRKYSLTIENEMIRSLNRSVDNQSLCDDIRASIVHALTLCGIGKLDDVFVVICILC
jgi:hypothetical protein